MGNNTSSSGSSNPGNNIGGGGGGRNHNTFLSATPSVVTQHHLPTSLASFRRGTGSLGLSRSELEKRCKPSGLYPTTPWDDRAIRRLIGDGKLAARLCGSDSRRNKRDCECPICFLHYSQVNLTCCCRAHICTECYLQVRPQKEKMSVCPFCNNQNLVTTVAKPMEDSDVERREENEQVVIEGLIRKQVNDAAPGGAAPAGLKTDEKMSPDKPEFGSSLKQHVKLRSDSVVSDTDTSSDGTPLTPHVMTAEERSALEDEMKKQHQHPLARRMQQEAEERRNQNDLVYRRGTGRLRSSAAAGLLQRNFLSGRRGRGGRRERDWNQIVEAFEHDLGTQVQSLDDLVVLEAAILLSMDEEAQRRRAAGNNNDDYDAQPMRPGGFPLLQALMSRRAEESEEDSDEVAPARARRLRGRGRGREEAASSPALFGNNAAAATASLLMRGVSEEDQIAMAIAMSLRDQGEDRTEAEESEGAATDGNSNAAGGDNNVAVGSTTAVTAAATSETVSHESSIGNQESTSNSHQTAGGNDAAEGNNNASQRRLLHHLETNEHDDSGTG